jgi:CBS domain containing-hemolysin-like protein
MLALVIAVCVVLIVSFLCSIFESVLLSLTRPQIELMVQRKKRAGRLLARYKENMDVPIAAILILNTAAHTIGAAAAGASYASVFDAGTLWIFSLVFTLAVLLLTEIIPKTLGVSYASTLAAPVAYGINFLTLVLKPMVLVSERISRSLRSKSDNPVTSTEEIRLLASLGRSAGVVGVKTAGIIVSATHLRHMHAHDLILPREAVRFLSADMDRRQVMDYVRSSGHSRFPFSPTGNLDDVTGVVLVKDLMYWLLQNEGEEIAWDEITREALIVPDSQPLFQLLRTYQDTRRHLAVVVDEYGSVEGIVTLEDVLEEIVGDIRDESDLPLNEVQQEPGGSLVVNAQVDLRRLSSMLGVPWDPEIEPTTVGGLVIEELERIPVVGDTIDWNDFRIEVLRADRRRVISLRVLRKP